MAKVVGFEWNSQEPEKAAAFYASVFGWHVGQPRWDYRSVDTNQNDEVTGGIAKGPEDYPQGTRIQIEVESIDETLTKSYRSWGPHR